MVSFNYGDIVCFYALYVESQRLLKVPMGDYSYPEKVTSGV